MWQKIKVIIWLALVAGVLATLVFLAFSTKPIVVDVATIHEGPFKEVIKSSGYLRSKTRTSVTAFAHADISRVDLKVGDRLKKGQKIATLHWDYDLAVISPMDGVVSKVFREHAGPIQRGEPIFEIVDPNNLEIVVELLTADAARVSIKDLVLVDVGSGTSDLKAQVIHMSQAGFTKTSALGVEEERTEVIAEFNDPKLDKKSLSERLGHNFHVEAKIVVYRSENKLSVPLGALFRDGKGWAVFCVVNNRALKMPVLISRRGIESALLESGLNGGDQVILYPGDLVKSDSKIELKTPRVLDYKTDK